MAESTKLYKTCYQQAIALWYKQNSQGKFVTIRKGSPEYLAVKKIEEDIKSGKIKCQLKPKVSKGSKTNEQPIASGQPDQVPDEALKRKAPDIQSANNSAPEPNAKPVEMSPAPKVEQSLPKPVNPTPVSVPKQTTTTPASKIEAIEDASKETPPPPKVAQTNDIDVNQAMADLMKMKEERITHKNLQIMKKIINGN